MTFYYSTEISSDLSPTWANTTDHDKKYQTAEYTGGGRSTVNISASSKVSIGWIAESGKPNNDSWEDGGTETVNIRVSTTNMNIRGRVRVVKLSSTGTVIESGSFTSFQTFSSSDLTFSATCPTWSGSEACTNRIAWEWELENIDTMMTQNVDIDYGKDVIIYRSTIDTSSITTDSASCTGGATYLPKCIMY